MIYHIATKREWQDCFNGDRYAPKNFAAIGFIHACREVQLEGVLQRYFKGQRDLILLELDESKLLPEIKYEVSTGYELFPHIFGAINKDAVIAVKEIEG